MRTTCIDFETANQNRGSACSVGIACIENGVVTESREWLLRPKKGYGFFLPEFTGEYHGLTWFDVKDAPEFDSVYQELKPYLEDAILIAHNARFDMSVLRSVLDLYEMPYPHCSYFCTCMAARRVWTELAEHTLNAVCEHIGHEFSHHKAGADAEAAGHVLLVMMKKCGVETPNALAEQLGLSIAEI